MRQHLLIAFLSGMFLVLPGVSYGKQIRHALVIGNDSYPGNALTNARNDARAMAETLRSLSYVTVLALDVDRNAMNATIDRFSASLAPGDSALVYYAGHGLQADGENYLIPTDFQISHQDDAEFRGYALHDLLDALTKHGATTEIVILDACRDNPFSASRSLKSGWAGMVTSAGTLVAYGTSPGSTASDAPTDGHGLFTKYLLKELLSSADIEDMFRIVRSDVIKESNGRQVPWTASSLIGSFHLDPRGDDNALRLEASVLQTQAIDHSSTRSVPSLDRISGSSDVARSHANGDEHAEALNQALVEVRGLHFEKALDILKAILSADPTCSIALRIMGAVYQLLGHSTDARRLLDQAIMVDPNDALSYSYRCWLNTVQGTSDTNSDCDQAARLGSNLTEVHFGQALSLADSGRTSEAYSEATRAIAFDPSSVAGMSLRGEIGKTDARQGSSQRDFTRAVQLTLEHAK